MRDPLARNHGGSHEPERDSQSQNERAATKGQGRGEAAEENRAAQRETRDREPTQIVTVTVAGRPKLMRLVEWAPAPHSLPLMAMATRLCAARVPSSLTTMAGSFDGREFGPTDEQNYSRLASAGLGDSDRRHVLHHGSADRRSHPAMSKARPKRF